MTLYRLHSTAIEVTKEQAQVIGADIFFRPPAYVVDVPKQNRRAIERSPIVPSFVVECHASYQLYFAAKEAVAPQVTGHHIAPFFAGQTVDYARKPGYLDVTTRVEKRWQHSVSYTARQLATAFPRVKQPAPAHVPQNSAASLVPSPTDEQHVLAGILQGMLPALPDLEVDHFCSPVRLAFRAIRNLEARGIAILPQLVHHELVAYDRLADQDHQYSRYSNAEPWPVSRLEQLVAVPIPVDFVFAAADRLDSRLNARRLVIDLDAEAERVQHEIDSIALEDAA